MTAAFLLSRDTDPTEQQVREELSGNLCRCTGYQHIVESVLAAARLLRQADQPALAPADP